jgi:hypothetical protein
MGAVRRCSVKAVHGLRPSLASHTWWCWPPSDCRNVPFSCVVVKLGQHLWFRLAINTPWQLRHTVWWSHVHRVCARVSLASVRCISSRPRTPKCIHSHGTRVRTDASHTTTATLAKSSHFAALLEPASKEKKQSELASMDANVRGSALLWRWCTAAEARRGCEQ